MWTSSSGSTTRWATSPATPSLERIWQRIAAAACVEVTARPGGDEFVCLVVGPVDAPAAGRVARAVTCLGRLGPDEAIVTASIAFAHALGLEVTAEGIETRAQLDRLADLGCDRGQGYLVGRPTRIEGVVAMLLTDRVGPRPLKQPADPLPAAVAAAIVG
jgi:predicted signal transduction protein with EAL and GGDEF domain